MIKTFSIQEVKQHIEGCIVKCLPLYEKSESNRQIMREHEVGFEAVLTGDGDDKILIPEDGTVVFLYRGQNKEYKPCSPSLYRVYPKELSPAETFLWRMRLVLFQDMVDSYPIVGGFFKRHNFKVDYEGLAQHYGLLTSVLDLTSNLDIALFFATCWYDSEHDCYRPYDDGVEHEGIIYVICPMLNNMMPPFGIKDFMKRNITPIGLQPFLRPARQKGYALHLSKGDSIKSWIYHIKFSCDESRHYYELFNCGQDLWIKDILVDKTELIKTISTFSFKTFDRAFVQYRPKGYSKNKLKCDLKALGISLAKEAPVVGFSEDECKSIINKWNNNDGKIFCDMIGRRPWYDSIDDSSELPHCGEHKADVSHPHYFRELQMIADITLLNLISHPEGPIGAERVDYNKTPKTTRYKLSKNEQGWTRIPGKFVNMFSNRYLTTEDYLIK